MIYFAYGLDMNPSQMVGRSPGHRSLGIARLENYWFAFPRFSPSERSATISIVDSAGSVVWGAVYEVPEEDVPILNHIHGFDPDGAPAFNEHIMREVNVQRLGHVQPLVAATYVAVPDEKKALPSEAYMTLVVDGARYHGLPKAYLAALQAVKTAP